ncbi:MAG TPA: ribbon-helix-helix protein, CopG family [Nakamurella sp.]
MAMTLRLPDDLDDQLQRLAEAQGLSKQQLLVRAAREYVTREARTARTLRNADRIVRDNTGLLDRLGQ